MSGCSLLKEESITHARMIIVLHDEARCACCVCARTRPRYQQHVENNSSENNNLNTVSPSLRYTIRKNKHTHTHKRYYNCYYYRWLAAASSHLIHPPTIPVTLLAYILNKLEFTHFDDDGDLATLLLNSFAPGVVPEYHVLLTAVAGWMKLGG